jgi:hypothetical protein
VVHPFREAGLPDPMDDSNGEHTRYAGEIGVVRKVYPELFRVDIEPQDGGIIYKAQVDGNTLPEVHIDVERPSYVEYWCRGGNLQDVWCSPIHWRRLKGPESATEPERRLYHKHLKIQRVGGITMRITPDDRIYAWDGESGDYCLYDMPNRTTHVLSPHVLVGTDSHNRIELHTETSDDRIRIVIPKALIGKTGIADEDGLSYTADQLLHLMSTNEVRATAGSLVHLIAPTIKMTASGSIVLDPPRIYLGNANATEQVILGTLFQAFWTNIVKPYIDAHVHSGVQVGGGTSAPPTTPFPGMSTDLLSDIVHVSKTGL